MYKSCLVCGSAFPRNELLEHLGIGQRIAFDPHKGRIWLICSRCQRWSLVPIEERWEALEEMEKLASDSARLRARTDNVALLRAGPLDLVRIGKAELVEEAWWRFGNELQKRRQSYKRISSVAAGIAAGFATGSVLSGGTGFVMAWLIWKRGPKVVLYATRRLRLGKTALRSSDRCPQCDRAIDAVRFKDRHRLVLVPAEAQVEVIVSCDRCHGVSTPAGEPPAGLVLPYPVARRTLRRTLAYSHFTGASSRRLTEATRLIEVSGGPQKLPGKVLRGGKSLGELGRIGAIALDIATSDNDERRLLAMEAEELEVHWQREEELAAIIDRELTPAPRLPGS